MIDDLSDCRKGAKDSGRDVASLGQFLQHSLPESGVAGDRLGLGDELFERVVKALVSVLVDQKSEVRLIGLGAEARPACRVLRMHFAHLDHQGPEPFDWGKRSRCVQLAVDLPGFGHVTRAEIVHAIKHEAIVGVVKLKGRVIRLFEPLQGGLSIKSENLFESLLRRGELALSFVPLLGKLPLGLKRRGFELRHLREGWDGLDGVERLSRALCAACDRDGQRVLRGSASFQEAAQNAGHRGPL